MIALRHSRRRPSSPSRRARDGGGSKTGGQRSRALTMPIPDSNRTASLRSCHTQRGHQFLIDDALDGGADPFPHQLLERTFSLPPTTAIAFHGVILRHPPPSGRELWLNSPDLDAFSFFYQLRDTTSQRGGTSEGGTDSTHPKQLDITVLEPACAGTSDRLEDAKAHSGTRSDSR